MYKTYSLFEARVSGYNIGDFSKAGISYQKMLASGFERKSVEAYTYIIQAGSSFNVSKFELRNYCEAGVCPELLIKRGQCPRELIKAGYDLSNVRLELLLVKFRFCLEELKLAGFTLYKLLKTDSEYLNYHLLEYSEVYGFHEVANIRVDASELLRNGVHISTLLEHNFSLSELRKGKVTLAELVEKKIVVT